MRIVPLLLALFSTGCGGGCRRPAVGTTDAAGADDAAAELGARDAAAVRIACRTVGRLVIPLSAAGPDAGVESFVAAPTREGVRAFWSIAGSATLGRWTTGQQRPAVVEAGAGERSDLVLATDGRGVLATAWVASRLGVREHVVWSADGPRGRCVGPEGRDEGLSLSLAGMPRGWLVAWDEDGPAPAAGSIRAQLAAVGPTGLLCGAQRTLSPAAQDAADPLAVALPGGRAAVFWLTARDVDATESNDTATDVWGVAVGATGEPVGAPLRVTRTVDHHFGLSAFAGPDAVWLALRGGGPSDSEGRGDGGEVRVVRVDVGALGLMRAGDLSMLTDVGANPTGAPRVTRPLSPGAAAEVWWRERQAERVEVRHRAIDASGRPLAPALPAWSEPALAGALPTWVDERATAWVPGVDGDGPGVARFACGATGR